MEQGGHLAGRAGRLGRPERPRVDPGEQVEVDDAGARAEDAAHAVDAEVEPQ